MDILFFIIGIAVFSLSSIWVLIMLGIWTYTDAKIRSDNAEIWTLIVVLANIVGLIIYLVVGRTKTAESPGRFKRLLFASVICFVVSIPLYVFSLINFVAVHSV